MARASKYTSLWRNRCFRPSHYEDVLAVRVNELCEETKWRKRFQHINNFEQLLVDEGTIILKFYLHIDREEQKSRLQQRINLPHKNWKFDPSDLVARKKWELYESAYEEVFEKTSLPHAPWYIIPANKKWSRNLLIAQIICATLDDLHLTYPKSNLTLMTHHLPKDPILLAPSLLAANQSALREGVEFAQTAGVQSLHLDIMDGHFVPNISFGPDVVQSLRENSDLFFDVHLML